MTTILNTGDSFLDACALAETSQDQHAEKLAPVRRVATTISGEGVYRATSGRLDAGAKTRLKAAGYKWAVWRIRSETFDARVQGWA